jgi:hypothetical protein
MPLVLADGLVPKRDHILLVETKHGEIIGPVTLPYFEIEKGTAKKFAARSKRNKGATCPECGRPRYKWNKKWVCPPFLNGKCSRSIDYSLAKAAMLEYEKGRPKRDEQIFRLMLLDRVNWLEYKLEALTVKVKDMQEGHQHQWEDEKEKRFCLPVDPPYWRVRCACGAIAYRRDGESQVIRISEPKTRSGLGEESLG